MIFNLSRDDREVLGLGEHVAPVHFPDAGDDARAASFEMLKNPPAAFVESEAYACTAI